MRRTGFLLMQRQNKPKQRGGPLSAGDGRPALMRQAGKGRGKMGDTEKRKDEQEESRKKIFEVIREEHYFKGDEEQAVQIIELLLSKPGKTVQDALDTLKDAKTILLRYHYIS